MGLDDMVLDHVVPRADAVSAVRELNRDELEEHSNARTIDTRTDLEKGQCPAMARCDFLERIGVFHYLSVLTNSFKRHRVSVGRKGRAEDVQIFQAVGTSARSVGDRLLGRNRDGVRV